MMENIYFLEKLENSYNFFNHSFSNRYMNWKIRHTIIESLRNELIRVKGRKLTILDLGCFEGDLIFKLSNLLSKKHELYFTGVDLSPKGIDFANKRSEFFNQNNCFFEVMDANNLKFNNEHFDIVICSDIIEHIENPQIIINEIHRTLKKGGLAIITTPNGGFRLQKMPVKMIHFLTANLFEKTRDREYQELTKTLSPASLQGQREKDIGLGHVSVKSCREWTNLFKQAQFNIHKITGTGGMVFGDPTIDAHRILFGFMVICDTVLEKFPCSYV